MSKATGEGRYPIAFHLVWGSALMLLVIGLVLIYSVSSALVLRGEDKFAAQYFPGQARTAAAGLILAAVIFAIDYRHWRRFTPLAVAGAVGALLLVHVGGFGVRGGGAERWLALGPVTVQPSELVKLAVVLYAAHLLARSKGRIHPDDLRAVAVVGAVACGLIVYQKDLGTALILAVALVGLLWVAGMRVRTWMLMISFLGGAAMLSIVLMPYRMKRLTAFLDPGMDPLKTGTGYQVRQGLVALGRGGLFGVGGGKGVQKFGYLPEAHTDMIFAVLGEEFGLVGVAVIVGLFALLAAAAIQLSRRCADPFGRYLIAGCAFLIFAQAMINIGGVMAALPLTGVPLPFISFGRNNLLVVMVSVGVILSVARWGPTIAPAKALVPVSQTTLESANVTYLDRGRRDGGARSARAGRR